MATTQTGVGATSPRPSDDIRCTYSDHGFSVRSASAQIAKSHQGVESGGETGLASTESSDGPDGGITAWLVVLGAWCASFCCYGWINSESLHPRFHVLLVTYGFGRQTNLRLPHPA